MKKLLFFTVLNCCLLFALNAQTMQKFEYQFSHKMGDTFTYADSIFSVLTSGFSIAFNIQINRSILRDTLPTYTHVYISWLQVRPAQFNPILAPTLFGTNIVERGKDTIDVTAPFLIFPYDVENYFDQSYRENITRLVKIILGPTSGYNFSLDRLSNCKNVRIIGAIPTRELVKDLKDQGIYFQPGIRIYSLAF